MSSFHGLTLFEDIPNDVIDIVFTYLTIFDALNIELVCKLAHCYIHKFYWNYIYENRVLYSHNIRIKTHLSKEIILSLLKFINRQNFVNLIKEVIETSSVDRHNEIGSNVIKKSRCKVLTDEYKWTNRNLPQELMYLFQLHNCKCTVTPCYWSSRPTSNPNTLEYIQFKVTSPISFIVGFSITPYQASFQDESPVYAPRYVSIQLFCLDGLTVYYESEQYQVENVFKQQTFILPRALLNVYSTVRIVFHGMQQRQPIISQSDYYVCISHATVIGFPLYGYNVEDNDNSNAKGQYNMIQSTDRSFGTISHYPQEVLSIDEIHSLQICNWKGSIDSAFYQ